MSGSNQFELVRVSIFIMMNQTEPKQAVQSGSVQSGLVHWFVVQNRTMPTLPNPEGKWTSTQISINSQQISHM